jgi:transglutaminase/protease-like cytokinesis protein 3
MLFITKILLKTIIVALTLLVALSGCSRVSSNYKPDQEPEYRVIGQSVTAGGSKNFYYDALSDAEKRGYDKIKTAVTEFTDFVTFDDTLSQIQIEKLFHLVYTQENGIFWLSELASANGDTNSLKMTLRMNSGNVKEMQAKLDDKVRALADNAIKDADSFGQVRYIHDFIVKNCKFQAAGDNINSAYGALVDGEAQCEGYAFAFGLLAKKLGFECVTVTGTSESGQSHAWNKIFLDDNWYNVDCTWDDPVISFDNPNYIRYYYLLVPDRDIMNISHFENTDYVRSPDATATACNYFYKTGLLFADSGAAGVSIYDQIIKAYPTRQTEIEIRFDARRAYDDTVAYLIDSKGLTGIIDRVNSEKNAGIKNAYHSENDNLYIIHISLVYA